jgi:hypothetical protein
MRALGQCDCFTPSDYAQLLETERLWFQSLMHFTRHRTTNPKAVDSEIITVMLYERTRWLCN